MRVALFAVAALSFSLYGWAVQSFFARPRGWPRRARVLSFAGLACAACHLAALATATLNPVPWLALALGCYALGLLLFGWAYRTTAPSPLPIAYSNTRPPTRITSGPFAVVPHPFYTAYSATWIAGVLAATNLVTVATTVAMVAAFVDLARREQRQLEDAAGARDR